MQIEVESIRRLDVKPGETLVVRVGDGADQETVEHIAHVMRERLPRGVDLLVVASDVELQVVAAG